MAKDLTSSKVDRQNILNNDVALPEIQKAVNIKCIIWNDSLYLTKDMVATFFNVDVRTIERYISKNTEELESNGYAVLKGKKLQEFLEVYESTFATDINVGRKIRALSVFDFRAFLNIAMLLAESETAAELRRIMLDIVIDTINQKSGGGTKYINQRDQDFIGAFLQEENYRREFTDALRDFVDMGNAKYGLYTDKIYQSIFKEKAKEYRQVLKLSELFLLQNGYLGIAQTFLAKMENISLNVAASKIDKDLLHKILTAIMNETYDGDEELKLEIYNSINRVL